MHVLAKPAPEGTTEEGRQRETETLRFIPVRWTDRHIHTHTGCVDKRWGSHMTDSQPIIHAEISGS